MTDFEAQIQPAESLAPPSPASQELEEFEAYNRTALPRLVEANLQAIVNTEMVPIEENLRRLLVDIVRRCQSTVAENFRVIRVPRRTSVKSPQPSSSHTSPPSPPRGEISSTDSHLVVPTTAHTTPAFFQEPPHVSVEAEASYARPPDGSDHLKPSQSQFADSAYGSSLEACNCNCHVDIGIDDSTNGLFAPWQSIVSVLTNR